MKLIINYFKEEKILTSMMKNFKRLRSEFTEKEKKPRIIQKNRHRSSKIRLIRLRVKIKMMIIKERRKIPK